MPTDLEIARASTPRPITDVAAEDTAGNLSVSATQFQSESSVRSITMPLNGADTYIFGIAVFDVTDAEFDSAVALDNFALIPEPRGATPA